MTLFSHFLFRFHLKAAALIASIKNFCDSGDLDGLRSVVTSGKILKLGVNDANQVGLDCDTNCPPNSHSDRHPSQVIQAVAKAISATGGSKFAPAVGAMMRARVSMVVCVLSVVLNRNRLALKSRRL